MTRTFSLTLGAALALASSAASAETLTMHLGDGFQNRATSRPVHIGRSGSFGTVPEPAGEYGVLIPGELQLGYTVGRNVTVGLSGLSLATADTVGGTRWAMSGGPYVEAFTFWGDRFQPYAQIGLPLQVRFEGNEDTELGLAPYASAGARMWLADFFTLGAETRVQIVATDHFLLQERVLPELAVPWTAGLTANFHF